MLLGKDLLSKMKDLLKRKPSLASLTSINESRLDCFTTHLRTYFIGTNAINIGSRTTTSSAILLDATCVAYPTYEPGQSSRSTLIPAKSSSYRYSGSQLLKTHTLYQGSLSPRSTSFKGLTKNLSSLRSVSREKLKPRLGKSPPRLLALQGLIYSSTSAGLVILNLICKWSPNS